MKQGIIVVSTVILQSMDLFMQVHILYVGGITSNKCKAVEMEYEKP